MEEKRFRLEAKKKIEALEERERREKETRRLNDLKWRESLEAQVAEKEQRELDMAIGNMSLRSMRVQLHYGVNTFGQRSPSAW